MHRHHLPSQWKEKGIEYIHVFGVDNAMELVDGWVESFWCVACGSVLFGLLPWVWKRSLHEVRGEVVSWRTTLGPRAVQASSLYGDWFWNGLSKDLHTQSVRRNGVSDRVRFRYHHDGFVSLRKVRGVCSSRLVSCSLFWLTCSCHIVKKATPYYDSILGRTIKPITPNAYRMQFYLTDILQLVRKLDVIMIPRAEYNPIRNPPGSECVAMVMSRKPCCVSRDSGAKHGSDSSDISPTQPSSDRGRVASCGDFPSGLGERRGPSAIEGSGDPFALFDLRSVRSGPTVRSDCGGNREAGPACGRLRRLSVLVMCNTLFASCLCKKEANARYTKYRKRYSKPSQKPQSSYRAFSYRRSSASAHSPWEVA